MGRHVPITGGTFTEPDDWIAWLRASCASPLSLPYFDWNAKYDCVPTEGVLGRLQEELAGTGLEVALGDAALRLFETGERALWADVRAIHMTAAPEGPARLVTLVRDRFAELLDAKCLWAVVRQLAEGHPEAAETVALLGDIVLRDGGRAVLDLATRVVPDVVAAHLTELVAPDGREVYGVFARTPEPRRAAMLDAIVGAGPAYAEAIAAYVAHNDAVARSETSRLVREHPATRGIAVDGSAQGELALLCQSCGLCCDGSLFGRVNLDPEEVDSARRHRLRVVADGRAFEQPCPALVPSGAGLGCSIYDDRPHACRRFVCKLYDRHSREGGPIEERIAVARRARALLVFLQGSGFSPTDFEGVRSSDKAPDPAAALPAYHELMLSLERDFSRVR
jgi:Fe-S-cluster containining protein